MRFLHTADWHIGKTLRGKSRIGEQESVLSEILEAARREKIDCLLICGDLYDSHAPSPDAERLVFQFFGELIADRIPAVVIGGNHDHPKRFAALSRLVEQFGVFIRPEPVPPDRGGVVQLSFGDETARIAVLPFVSERRIVDAVALMGDEDAQYANYQERMGGMLKTLSGAFDDESVNILMGHLYMQDALASGSERAIHVSKPYEVSAADLPDNCQYVALGHLHRPQQVKAGAPTWYAGSTLQLDFGEQLQEKRVVIADAQAGRPARLTSVPLTQGRRLRDVGGTLVQLEKDRSEWGDDFLRVTVDCPGPVPGIADQVREILPNAVDVRIDYPRSEQEKPEKRLGKMTPETLFAEFHLRQRGAPPSSQVGALFRELYQEVAHEAD